MCLHFIASGFLAFLLKYSTKDIRPLLVNYLKVLSDTYSIGLIWTLNEVIKLLKYP